MLPELIPLKPNRVWRTYTGGRTLDEIEGKPSPEDGHFPEDWIGSTSRAINPKFRNVPEEGLSLVDRGTERVTLRHVIEESPEQMLGPPHYRRYGATTQFLLKFLDSAIRLHLQCHPTAAFSRAHLGSESGKTEAYIILGTRSDVADPCIWLGFQRPPSRERLKTAIETQDTAFLQSCFDRIPVKAGDVFIVPGGFPHVIGEGVFMIEVMEPTDFVARLEFERGGYTLPQEARFMGRDVDFGLSMIDFNSVQVEEVRRKLFIRPRPLPCPVAPYSAPLPCGGTPPAVNGVTQALVIGPENTDCFSVKLTRMSSAITLREHSFYIAVVTEGQGEVYPRRGRWAAERYDRFFVPFATEEITFVPAGRMEIYQFFPPDPSSG